MPPQRSRKAGIWTHFSIVLNNKAKCDYCQTLYAYKGGSTSMQKHLKTRHPTIALDDDEGLSKIFCVYLLMQIIDI